MNQQPNPLRFVPVPAVPIVVLSHREGEARVLACGGVFTGPTLCAVLDAACKMDAKL